jgi:DNA (cytosine-5)-methyltransferase 1
VDRPQELTHISLCAGYGGIDLGLQRALGAVRTIAFSEIESYACANLVAKMEAGLLDSAPIWTDLKTFPWSEFRGKVDILSGGFPCQPFSAAGARRGDEDPRHLFPHILRGLRELGGPALVFLENVEGIISSKLTGDAWADPQGTPVLLHVLRELERVGYSVTAGVFSASEVGATHQRKRVFILGVRADLGDAGHSIVNAHMAHTVNTGDAALRDNANGYGEARGGERGGNKSQRELVRCGPLGGICGDDSRPLDTRATAQQTTKQLTHVADSLCGRGDKREQAPDHSGADDDMQRSSAPCGLGARWPAGRGAQQHAWEPPRVTPRASHGHPEPTVGGDADGSACGLDYAQLCVSRDSLVDELRLLGNGVVPATAERAFRVLWAQLHAP